MSMPTKEWRCLETTTGVRHVLEIVHGGVRLFYCTDVRVTASPSIEPITLDTPLTCLWCAAWWSLS